MEKQFVNPDGLAKPGVFTPAIAARGGKTIHVSGQVSQDGAGNVVGKGDLPAQTEQVYRNLAANDFSGRRLNRSVARRRNRRLRARR